MVGQLGQVRAIEGSSFNGMRHMGAVELREMLAEGWGVGNHSWSHGVVNAATSNLELAHAKEVLEQALGELVTVYCSPGDNSNMNEEALAACRRLGYLAAMSLTDALNRPDDTDLLWLNRTFLHTRGYGPFFSEFDPWRNIRHAQQERGWIIDYCHCPLQSAVHPNKDCSAGELRRRIEAVVSEGGEEVWLARVEEAVDYRWTRRATEVVPGANPGEFHVSAPVLPAAVRRRVVTLRLPGDTARATVDGADVPIRSGRAGLLIDVNLARPRTLRLVRKAVEVAVVSGAADDVPRSPSHTAGPGTVDAARQHAAFGAAAHVGLRGRLPQPYPRPMGANTMRYLQEVVDSGLAADMAGRFEQAFARAIGVKHCVATPGCSNAMAVLALALGLEPGDEVVMSPISDFGTVMGFIHAGLIPVFADIDPSPGNPNVTAATLAPCVGPRTRAIVCVHMTGVPCDMDPIAALGRHHGIPVFEDACQSVLGKYKGRFVGTLAHGGVFSFDSEKSIGSDIGGCLVTNDDRLAEAARFLGHARGGEMRPGFGRMHTAAGLAMRMPQCTAAVTLAQIEEAPARIAARDRAARRILRGLADIPGIIPLSVPDYADPLSCWMLGFNVESGAFRCTPDEFGRQLDEAGIPGAGTARYYLLPSALPFLSARAGRRKWPYDAATTARLHRYDAGTVPHAARFLETFIRWSTFCEKYTEADAGLAVEIVREVAEKNRIKS